MIFDAILAAEDRDKDLSDETIKEEIDNHVIDMSSRNITTLKREYLNDQTYKTIAEVEKIDDPFSEVLTSSEGKLWNKVLYREDGKQKSKYFTLNKFENVLSVETYIITESRLVESSQDIENSVLVMA